MIDEVYYYYYYYYYYYILHVLIIRYMNDMVGCSQRLALTRRMAFWITDLEISGIFP
jgi:hypothetical protein